jgi:hypothetical protein
MKKVIFSLAFFASCTQYGHEFIDCTDKEKGETALDISISNMDSISEVVDRTDFICTEEQPMPDAACYIARGGDQDFGNRGMIVLQDEYIGQCVIHELYHVQLAQTLGDSCANHSRNCNWDSVWLETLLDEYQTINEQNK